MLQYAAQAEDPYFKEALYNTLVDLKATPELLKMDSPELAAYLRSSGGLPERDATQRGSPLGPLNPSRVRHLTMLPYRCIAFSPGLYLVSLLQCYM